MKIIIGAIVFGLIAISIIVMLVINFTYKGFKKVKEDVVDDYYQHQKEKELKEKHPFDKDYFKSASTKKNQHTGKQNNAKSEKPKQKPQQETRQEPQQEQKKTTNRTAAGSHVTIIDDRETRDKRKIFDDQDGEYVEFEEVSD